jgi:hypothetical protein
MKYIALIGVTSVLLLWVLFTRYKAEEQSAKTWVEDRGEKVVSIAHCSLLTGPYTYDSRYTVMKVETQTNTYWIRYTWMGDQVYSEATPGQYKQMQ